MSPRSIYSALLTFLLAPAFVVFPTSHMCSASGDDKAVSGKNPAVPAAARFQDAKPTQTTINMVFAFKTDGSVSKGGIEQTFYTAMEWCQKSEENAKLYGRCNFSKPIHVDAIDEASYLDTQGFILSQQGDRPTSGGARAATAPRAPLGVKRLSETVWELSFDPPDFQVTKVTVTYAASPTTKAETGNSQELKVVRPDSTTVKEDSLTMNVSGRYLLNIAGGRIPQRIKAEGERNKTAVEPLEVDIPLGLYWRVVVNDYEGDPETLFALLGDDDHVVGNGYNIPRPKIETLVRVGQLKVNYESLEERFDAQKSEYVVKVNKIKGMNLKRVWMLFPILSKEELEHQLLTYNGFELAALAEKITSTKPILDDDKSFSLEPSMKSPVWIELAPNESDPTKVTSYGRRIPVTDMEQWRERSSSKAYRIIAWEFDNGVRPQIKKVLHPARGLPTDLVDEEAPVWSKAIGQRSSK